MYHTETLAQVPANTVLTVRKSHWVLRGKTDGT